MKEYDYRGYVITEVPSGYFITNGCTFFSYDEACDWIDDQLDGVPEYIPNKVPELHLYHIFYVTKSYDQGYEEFIQAYNQKDAEKYLKRMHRDLAYIADIYEVD